MIDKTVERIDEIISAMADSNSEGRRQELSSLIMDSEIFSVVEEIGDKVSLQTANIDGKKMVVFHTSRSGKVRGQKVAGMKGEKAIEMVSSSDSADGILLQSSHSDSWVAISNSKLEEMLDD